MQGCRNGDLPESLARKLEISTVLQGHTGCVNRLAWNQDGSLLASASDDCQVRWQPHVLSQQQGRPGTLMQLAWDMLTVHSHTDDQKTPGSFCHVLYLNLLEVWLSQWCLGCDHTSLGSGPPDRQHCLANPTSSRACIRRIASLFCAVSGIRWLFNPRHGITHGLMCLPYTLQQLVNCCGSTRTAAGDPSPCKRSTGPYWCETSVSSLLCAFCRC